MENFIIEVDKIKYDDTSLEESRKIFDELSKEVSEELKPFVINEGNMYIYIRKLEEKIKNLQLQKLNQDLYITNAIKFLECFSDDREFNIDDKLLLLKILKGE